MAPGARASYSTFHYFDSKADPRNGHLLPDSTSGNTSIGAEIIMAIADTGSSLEIFNNDTASAKSGSALLLPIRSQIRWISPSVTVPVLPLTYTNIRTIPFPPFVLSPEEENTNGKSMGRRYHRSIFPDQHPLEKDVYQEGGYWMAPETNITGIIFYGQPTGIGDTTFKLCFR